MSKAWLSSLFVRCAQSLGAVLSPMRCVLCGTVTESPLLNEAGHALCPRCLHRLERTEQFHLRGNRTEDMFYTHPQFERGACFLFYDKAEHVNRLVYAFKYFRTPELAYDLALQAAKEALPTDFFDTVDVIMPIPLHPRRFRQRGYNQSEYIARGLSDVTKIPYDIEHLTRMRNNPQQARIRGNERARNVEGIFAVNHSEELYRKHILLVDDVITTGSTMRACMDAMRAFRGARISVFALAQPR